MDLGTQEGILLQDDPPFTLASCVDRDQTAVLQPLFLPPDRAMTPSLHPPSTGLPTSPRIPAPHRERRQNRSMWKGVHACCHPPTAAVGYYLHPHAYRHVGCGIWAFMSPPHSSHTLPTLFPCHSDGSSYVRHVQAVAPRSMEPLLRPRGMVPGREAGVGHEPDKPVDIQASTPTAAISIEPWQGASMGTL